MLYKVARAMTTRDRENAYTSQSLAGPNSQTTQVMSENEMRLIARFRNAFVNTPGRATMRLDCVPTSVQFGAKQATQGEADGRTDR